MTDSHIEVIVQIGREEVLAGGLWSHRRRNAESATFSYDASFLSRSDAYELDPALTLIAGQQQTRDGRAMFGAFSDCAPDRWGRRLIARAESQRVRLHGGTQRSFGEIDYLLGVRDDLRQGSLRFRDPKTGVYLAEEITGVPALLELSKLLRAADRLERSEENEDELKTLLRGGSSLGGARPKAHILDSNRRIAIAKFPSPSSDNWDVIRWEAIALALARGAGIRVPDWSLHIVDGKAVLVVDRFDRIDTIRIGYTSAMTMLEASDGAQRSYLEIAQVIEEHSPQVSKDLTELWRRIAFSVLISNTDDHLRNHGFLRASTAGWTLSPAFDLNPDPRPGPKHLTTALDFDDTTASVDLLMSIAEHFRLNRDQAHGILREVSDSTRRWRSIAKETGLDRTAIEQMEPAFEHNETKKARAAVRKTRP